MQIDHEGEALGEVASREDAEALRESIRGREYRFGIVSNALDFSLTGDERHLVYLSPRDRRKAEAMAAEINDAIATAGSNG